MLASMKTGRIIISALREDRADRDITTQVLIPAGLRARAEIVARQKGVVCGLSIAADVFRYRDKDIKFRPLFRDGDDIRPGDTLARILGRARAILSGERVALNFLGRLSGISTLTAAFVKQVAGYAAEILDTRKTTPLLREMEKYAVRCGGGVNHRPDLSRQVLIKENHISLRPRRSLAALIAKSKDNCPQGTKIEVEVRTLREFRQVISASADIIMLDNFALADIRKAVEILRARADTLRPAPQLEVSGGVSLSNVRSIAACGVERISIGALTHSAPCLDMSLGVQDK
ncbi:MAG: carboxylating nicotinate-nucleotide diphosphorylase [Candidatus Omnitrophota bacterium]